MEVYEKIFERLNEIKMSQSELSRRTGISTSTISDWKKKKINPQADKIKVICEALEISSIELFGETEFDYTAEEKQLIEIFRESDGLQKSRVLSYLRMLAQTDGISKSLDKKTKRNVSVIQDPDGKNIVMINDIRFKGKRSVEWKEVRAYLKEYVGEIYTMASTGDAIYIGSDLPKEYAGSNYTKSLRGTNAKAKANASQGIPEIIEIAVGGNYRKNDEKKHNWNARFGWYRYDSSFALPVYDESGDINRYNVFHVSLLVRHASDGKRYLYDIIDIKKETSIPLEP